MGWVVGSVGREDIYKGHSISKAMSYTEERLSMIRPIDGSMNP